jgi:peptidoglycan/LPS O-acetylase OafA/YrhL
LFWTVAAGNDYYGVLVHPATRCLGTISYSIYLLHGILLTTTLKVLASLIDFATLPLPAYCCLVSLLGVMLVLICAVTYRWVEHPLLVWRTPWERSRPALPTPAFQAPPARLAQ